MDSEQEPPDKKPQLNRLLIQSVHKEFQASELQNLDLEVYDQIILEKGILDQVNEALAHYPSESSGYQSVQSDKSENDLSIVSKDVQSECQLSRGPESWNNLELDYESGGKKRRRLHDTSLGNELPCSKKTKNPCQVKVGQKRARLTGKVNKGSGSKPDSDSDYVPDHVNSDSDADYGVKKKKPRKNPIVKNKPLKPRLSESDDSCWTSSEDEFEGKKSKKKLDDGNLNYFMKRTKHLPTVESYDKFVSLHTKYRIPSFIWEKLFLYQQDAIKWFWNLHVDGFGGILGDEMGLGKTVQMVSFLAGLHYSNEEEPGLQFRGLGPSIIVCPTTIMHQWVREFHHWYPHIRVAILHESGTYNGKDRSFLIKSINTKTQGVLITSYQGLLVYKDEILRRHWHYVILDEGHKIRNPEAQVTEVAKSIMSGHRIILSGSPMQNNLKELWSLFDFIIPGKLGSLAIFTASFVNPIVQGGYVNASKAQVVTAFKCAMALRDVINPFLLRRSKAEVDIKLPAKTEQVLFCKLTDAQREVYKSYLSQLDIHHISENKGRLFAALVTMRKICNHPDLYTGGPSGDFSMTNKMFGEEKGNVEDFGYWQRSGKMIVLVNLLDHWHRSKQRVLLFTQGKKMLQIMENFIKRSKYKYLKLDGGTSISARQPLIDKFNTDSSYFVMLLTTRVGGLGVNLTGANKVVIFDPDWNPATDTQARERAWRIGQSKDVTIFRLICSGTIEEKIYHRQIFKQFLSNKVLKDPKQRRFFKSNDLVELFTLNETIDGGTNETAAIFAGTGSEIKFDPKALRPEVKKKAISNTKILFSKEKIEEMLQIAQRVSKKLAELSEINKPKESNKEEISDSESDIYGPDGQLVSPIKINKGVCHKIDKTESPAQSSQSDNAETRPPSKAVNKQKAPPTHKPKPVEPTHLKKAKKSKSKNKEDRNEGNSSKISKRGKFEGKNVPHLVKCKKVKRDKKEDIENFKCQDDYILHKLLKKSGIDTAMKHDTIMGVGPSDYTIVEAEASKVAKQALDSIANSNCPANYVPSNPLTREIHNAASLRNLASNEAAGGTKSLLSAMMKWLNSRGGTASTQQFVEEFKDKVETSKSAIFKALLSNIASFHRDADNVGYWTIKSQYK